MQLDQSPPEVQLAVELIYILECNAVKPDIVLAALDIIKRDYQDKLEKLKIET